MLRQAFLLSVLLVLAANGHLLSDLALFDDQNHDYFQPFPFSGAQVAKRSSEHSENDREELGPDYKDPKNTEESKEKPVLNPKKDNKKPKQPTLGTGFIGGGVVDVDASTGGFPSFPSPFGPAFDFPTLPGLDSQIGSGSGIASLFGLDEGKKWWQGKNICIEREESTDDEHDDKEKEEDDKKNDTEVDNRESNLFSTSIRLSNCFETDSKYECITRINNHGVVKTFTVRYKCCYGFKRTPGSDGCTEQVDLKPLLQTLDDLKFDEFHKQIKNSGLEDMFKNGNYTIFVPTDGAIHDYNDRLNDINGIDQARRRRAVKVPLSSKELVLSHTTNGFVDLSEVENEEIFKSMDQVNSPIRINIYPTYSGDKMTTANCARLVKSNILTDNGIVHVVDRTVAPATESIENIIDSNPSLSSFKRVLENTDIKKHIKPDGHYTVFAATDEAFNKLNEQQRQKLLNGGGCASSILKHHFVAHTVCSSAIIGNATTHNVEGINLNMERTLDDDLIFENKAKIVEADIIGTNGVIHLIDTLIIPESGQYISNMLKTQNFSMFQNLIEKAGLTDELDNYENATVFVPTNKAFESPEGTKLLKEIENDPEQIKELLKYHIADGKVESLELSNNMKLNTKAGKGLRVNLYSTLPLFTNVINRATINCAPLIHFDKKTCGSIVHQVNRILVPPKSNILDVISTDERYSKLKELIAGTEVEKVLQESNRSLTLLAPTDEAFAAMRDEEREPLFNSTEKADEFIKNHILTEVLCCSGVGPHTWGFNSFIPTLGEQRVEIGRTGSRIFANRAVVTKCDQLATNGVVHSINKALIPRKRTATLGGGFLFFDI
ncbi:transforming growth factor-beta-induced protein ig-h3 [Anthonomus grandis grandis]|uniref:transforming growth factor-beta-induced protein ig-h3 n=1 Tax=Anthonomus grandis grandis TaxID=2921223 RepID=UPI002165AE58|nr:transforming growth factor-beta-induced protein ig-h3 [Anthonomus grandis grandis]